ncbi:hypothetical protein G6O67_005191 [Ophiocordyceps sinensis]|uniref:5'-3' DNA helicase ZGRF1-like N-terminal domain-containing protein n=1 Tax=Ophiocordyceps sinensis TaxID=72228 RepID=A0A8H4PR18_9HYPO|nr:hypothetical protein G6O67_005191 [Ophiocordyceps sinensis]
MSYAVRRPADPLRSSGAADTPTTATVLDYMCLFTHDLRRKQKRWQDGRLKFHTFNKRVMVYDDRGNFIGDSHWHSSDALDEGDELELDRGSAIVQVADCTGSREQDLTELLDKRAKEVGQRRASAAARTTPAQQTPVRRHEGQQRQPQTHFQLKHRPLSAIVPSPGPIGRAAIPARSPFEARLAEAGGEQQQPPVAKRRRVCVSPPSKKGFAQSLFGAKLTLSACPTATPPATVRVSKKLPGTGRLPESHEIAENEDDDVVMLDGPPLGPRNMAAKPAQLRAGSAKVMPAATLQVKPWRPRITKMARKSVRSREIIGYIPPVEDDMVPALFAASARRNALWANPVLSVGSTCASAPPAVIAERGGEAKARPRGNPDANVEAAAMPAIAPLKKPVGTMTPEEAPPKEPTKASMPAAEPPKELAGVTMAEPASPGREAAQGQGPNRNPDADNGPRPRMSNPATRGKKATRKEDAAGHPLQNLVPMEPAAPARAAPAPTVEPKRPESVLPGFSRANGGAWSKHAEDLLGMTRPTERTRGR